MCLRVQASANLPAPAAVQLAVEHELDVPVQLDPPCPPHSATIAVQDAGPAQAQVSLIAADGKVTGRALRLPAESARAAEMIALLAASLARDDAAELLESLRAAKAKAAVLAPPPPAPLPLPPSPPTLPAAAAPPSVVAAPDAAAPGGPLGFAVDLLPGISFPPPPLVRSVRSLSLGIIGTWSPGLDGVEGALVFALKSNHAKGIQMAGALCAVGGDFAGAQGSFGVNAVGGQLRGVQAGMVNLARRIDYGAQGALVNIAGPIAYGGQFGLANLALGDVRGLQGGLLNVAAGDMAGVQGGLLNVAKRRANVQVGLLNLGQDADAGIGLLSLYWRGRTHVEAWSQDWARAMIGVKHGSRLLHNIFAFGVRSTEGKAMPVLAFGLGGRLRLSDRWHLDADGIYHLLLQGGRDFHAPPGHLLQLRALAGLRLAGSLTLFAGPTLNALVSSDQSVVESWTPFGHGFKDDRSDFDPIAGSKCVNCKEFTAAASLWPGVVVGLAGF